MTKAPVVQGFFSNPTEKNRNYLEIFIHELMKNRPRYFQAAVLDSAGMELFRLIRAVDSENVKIVRSIRVPNNARSLKIAMQLEPDETYLSPIVTAMSTDVSFKPAIHIAQPVFGSDGTNKGLIVLYH
ncbi:PDC sensor domain-containing protein, partial [bacterium]|nr:PDC sensor domain-containing protein [bacterium]